MPAVPPMPMRPQTKPAFVFAALALSLVFGAGCQSTAFGTPELDGVIDTAYPALTIEVDRLADTIVSEFTRDGMAREIGERLRASSGNPFQSIRGHGQEARQDAGQKAGQKAEEEQTLIAHLTLTRYDRYDDFWMSEIDPLYRLKISGILDLIDGQTGALLASRDMARIISLGGFDDLSGFNSSRSPLFDHRHVRIHGLGHMRSKAQMLEHAFISSVVGAILSLVPPRPAPPDLPAGAEG